MVSVLVNAVEGGEDVLKHRSMNTHLEEETWEKMSTLLIIFKKENAPEIANCKTILISISICIFLCTEK